MVLVTGKSLIGFLSYFLVCSRGFGGGSKAFFPFFFFFLSLGGEYHDTMLVGNDRSEYHENMRDEFM